jgi:hypothetical protein
MPRSRASEPDVEIVASAVAEDRFDTEPKVTPLSRDGEARLSPGDESAERRLSRPAREEVPTSVRRDANQQPPTRSGPAPLSGTHRRNRLAVA